MQPIAAPLITITTTAKGRAIVDIPASSAIHVRTSATKGWLTTASIAAIEASAFTVATDTADLGAKG